MVAGRAIIDSYYTIHKFTSLITTDTMPSSVGTVKIAINLLDY